MLSIFLQINQYWLVVYSSVVTHVLLWFFFHFVSEWQLPTELISAAQKFPLLLFTRCSPRGTHEMASPGCLLLYGLRRTLCPEVLRGYSPVQQMLNKHGCSKHSSWVAEAGLKLGFVTSGCSYPFTVSQCPSIRSYAPGEISMSWNPLCAPPAYHLANCITTVMCLFL